MSMRTILAMFAIAGIATAAVYVMSGASSAEHASIRAGLSAISEGASSPRAIVTIMVGNSSNQVLFDYVGTMDLAGIDALAGAHQADLIPREQLLPKLPAPLAGWMWAMPGATYSVINVTYAIATGVYLKGTIESFIEMAQVGIHHQVGGWPSEEWEEEKGQPPENVTWDVGYPKEHTIQGYPAIEARASGANLGEEFSEMNVDAIGMLWVGLGAQAPAPEISSMFWTFAALVSMALFARIGRG